MIQVIRFSEWLRWIPSAQPGRWYHSSEMGSIYDYRGTDRAVLDKFEKWRKENPALNVVSITGPLWNETEPGGGSAGGKYVELTVLYEDAQS